MSNISVSPDLAVQQAKLVTSCIWIETPYHHASYAYALKFQMDPYEYITLTW